LLEGGFQGSIRLQGQEASELNDDGRTRLRRELLGFVYQFHHLLPEFNARENVVLPQLVLGTEPKAADQRAEALLGTLGLSSRLDHRPSKLSGGEQQRVAVARALVSRPSVMFADEPTGNLDSTTSGEILALLRDSVDTLGQTTVMVTHDAHAAAIADRVLFLADGDIVRDLGPSTAHEILETLEDVTER
jgi:ABC-type lipoprotein export system ATPase subunit